ncbi:MAG: cobyrinate a,c-diamide synthase, partial [Firmicutes bacterium]|nr:cobyrinate a,c-diamide synthase [Bacillota bacterium]
LAVLEGVMGLFDGLGGTEEEGSSYHLAKVTRTPIILVVDAKGMGRSVLPMIAGFLAYDTEKLIKGVILNRMSKAYYDIVKPLIEEELGICVAGYFPENKNLTIESRHLGLQMPGELEGIAERLEEAAETLEKTVSVERIVEIASGAEDLEPVSDEAVKKASEKNKEADELPIIAVAKDEAFCFYYEDNLRLLREYGAGIRYFSPIHDSSLPKGCSAILLGGGYPELYARQLSANKAMHEAIRRAAADEMPIVAECGGFMYLHSEITDKSGTCYQMAGVLPGTCHYTGKLVRFGYIEINEQEEHFLPSGGRIRGHEFHYFDSTDNGGGCIATKPAAGRTYPCVISGRTYWLGFPHLYYPSNPAFAKSFVQMAAEYRKNKNSGIT